MAQPVDESQHLMDTAQVTPDLPQPPEEEHPSITALYGSLHCDGPAVSLSEMDAAITQTANEIAHVAGDAV